MEFIFTTISSFVLDRVSKIYVKKKVSQQDPRRYYAKGQVFIDHTKNKGLMLNKLDAYPKVVKGINILVALLLMIIIVPVYIKDGVQGVQKYGLGFLLGGGLGNLYDRLVDCEVTDFIGFKATKNVIFNIADLFIFLGGLLVLVGEGFKLIKR